MNQKQSDDQQWVMDAPVGRLYLVASARALHAVTWTSHQTRFARGLDENAILRHAVTQLEEYFAGARDTFDLPLDPRGGTPFQRLVWDALGQIEFGATRSYSELARSIGHARAVRAVGAANGKNPLCVVVPCHRVIAADGSLGGFAGGLAAKAVLLNLEQRRGRDAACLTALNG